LHKDGTLYGNIGAFGNDGRGFAGWDNDVTWFKIVPAGSPWAGEIVDLHANGTPNGTLYVNVGQFGNTGRGFAPWDAGVTALAIAPAGSPWAGDITD
jgi:hypothetical protein